MSFGFRPPAAAQPAPAWTAKVRSWFGREEEQDRPPNWQESVYSDVGEFLFDNKLDPTPDNYDLAFQYRMAANSRLVDAIRSEIERSGSIDSETAERIFVDNAGPASAESLATMADQMDAQMASLTGIAAQSGRDADDFRTALEDRCSGEATPEPTSLLELTQTMIARTRAAETQLKKATRELRGLRENLAEAKKIADVDPLTELANRRAFKRELEQAMAAAQQGGRPLSIAFCDIDHFKRLNDTHGHETGDRVLRFVATTMTRRFEKKGLVARFGGEEFVIMFPNTTPEMARDLVDGCRVELSSRRIYTATDNVHVGMVTFSGGVTEMREGDEMADLLRRSDETLYRAKGDGRNRILIAE